MNFQSRKRLSESLQGLNLMSKNVLSTETRTGFCRDQLRKNPDVTIAEVRDAWNKTGSHEYMSSQILATARQLHRKEVGGLSKVKPTVRVAARVTKTNTHTQESHVMSNGRKTEERIIHATPKGESEILEDIEIKLDDLIFTIRDFSARDGDTNFGQLLDPLKAARRAAILLQGKD